jgi:hypothetical protein
LNQSALSGTIVVVKGVQAKTGRLLPDFGEFSPINLVETHEPSADPVTIPRISTKTHFPAGIRIIGFNFTGPRHSLILYVHDIIDFIVQMRSLTRSHNLNRFYLTGANFLVNKWVTE